MFPKTIDAHTDFDTVIQMRRLRRISKKQLVDYLIDNDIFVSYDNTFDLKCSIYDLDGRLVGTSDGINISRLSPELRKKMKERDRRNLLRDLFGKGIRTHVQELTEKEIALFNAVYVIPSDNEVKGLLKKAGDYDAIAMLKLMRYYLLSPVHANVKRGLFFAKFIPLCKKFLQETTDPITATLLESYAAFNSMEYSLKCGDKSELRKVKQFFASSPKRVLGFGRLLCVQVFIKEHAGDKNIEPQKFSELEAELSELEALGFYYANFLLAELYVNCSADTAKAELYYKKAGEYGFMR